MKRDYLGRRFGPLLIAFIGIIGLVLALLFLLPSHWPEGSIFVPRDLPTLKEALEEVKPGGTIVLQAGEGPFYGPVVVAIEGITIASSGLASLEGKGGEPAIAIRADGVTVRGLRVSAPAIGVSVEGSRCTLDRIFVESTPIGVRITGSSAGEFSSIRVEGSDTAVEVSACVGSSFNDLVIVSPADSGIVLIDSRANLIAGVRISGGKIGISLEGSDENGLSAVTIEGCVDVGVRFAASNENRLTDSFMRRVDTAVVIENAQGNLVEDCRIEDAAVGCSLRQAVQNGITRTTFVGVHDAGVLVIGSRENAIFYNRFSRFGDAGVMLQGSERSLVLANVVEAGMRGITSENSSDSRILRNVVSRMGLVGVAIIDGADDRILDNRVVQGPLGIVIVRSSGETASRNRIESSDSIGLALLNGSDNGTISENQIRDNATGILLAYSGRENLSENEIFGNSTGLRIYRTGPATRIERNTFVSNAIGLKQDEVLNLEQTALDRLGVKAEEGEEKASPIIVNNVFDRNLKFDVENDGSDPLYVAGNWWGGIGNGRTPEEAVVSSGVILPESAWKGRVAIGTATGIAERILGHILCHALIEGGYQVIDLIGLGEERKVEEALRSRDVDIVWLTVLEDPSSQPTEQTGFGSLTIPAEERAIAVVSEALAERLAKPSLSALAAYGVNTPLVVAAPRSLSAAEGLVEAYGISPARGGIQWADALEEVEALLKFGVADLAIVPSLEESLTLSGFIALRDDRNVAKGESLILMFENDLTERYPDIRGIIADLAPRLTTSVLHELVSRVRLFGKLPEEAVEDFFEKKGGYVE